jgi:glutamine---fructose-6-phosphate transaminase (isomerizing)
VSEANDAPRSTSFREALRAQPENLEAAARAMRERLGDVDLAPLGGTVVFSGIGASRHALVPAVRGLRAAGRRAFAVGAAELAELPPGLADAYVVVSQSGRSAETLAAVERLAGRPVYAIAADGGSPVARTAHAWLPLGDRADSQLSTLGYTATLQALGMLVEAIVGEPAAIGGGASGRAGGGAIGGARSGSAPPIDWSALPDLVAGVLEAAAPVARELGERLAGVGCIDAVGGGASLASAGAAALLVREGLRLPATGEETRQYLHGPLEPVDSSFGCLVFGAGRERELAAAMASYGATVALIGSAAAPGVAAVPLPGVPDLARPILEILPVQLAVERAAAARGLDLAGLSRPQDDTKLAA